MTLNNIILYCLTNNKNRIDNIMIPQLELLDIPYEIYHNNYDTYTLSYNLKLYDSEVSISIGHYKIKKMFIESNYDWCVICEDDVLLNTNYLGFEIEKYFNNSNNFKLTLNEPIIIYGCCYLGYNKMESIKTSKKYSFIKTTPQYGNPMYIINKKYAKIALENVFPIIHIYDKYMEQLVNKYNISSYYADPFLCCELSSGFYKMFYNEKAKNLALLTNRTFHIDYEHENKSIYYNDNNTINNYIINNCFKIESVINYANLHILLYSSIEEYCNSKSIICGSGINNPNIKFDNPYLTIFIRGPLSRDKFIEYGYYCPENYGSPLIIIPKYYNPSINKKYNIGFIDIDCIDIDINNTNINSSLPLEQYIDKILECRYIASNTLSGIILSHAYGINVAWIKKLLYKNENNYNFIFNDYYKSFNMDIVPLYIDSPDLLNSITSYPNPTSEQINNMKKNVLIYLNFLNIMKQKKRYSMISKIQKDNKYNNIKLPNLH